MDSQVIQTLNNDFIPVWINVRTTPVPAFPDRAEVLMVTRLDDDDRVEDLGSQGFFLRLVVLDPTDLGLLNRQAPTAEASVETFLQEGHFAYAQASAEDVLEMLANARKTAIARGLYREPENRGVSATPPARPAAGSELK